MMEVNIHEAKTHLSRLLVRVASGEEIVISKAGVPLARLIPFREDGGSRPLGIDRDSYRVPADFNHGLPDDLLADFEGGAGETAAPAPPMPTRRRKSR